MSLGSAVEGSYKSATKAYLSLTTVPSGDHDKWIAAIAAIDRDAHREAFVQIYTVLTDSSELLVARIAAHHAKAPHPNDPKPGFLPMRDYALPEMTAVEVAGRILATGFIPADVLASAQANRVSPAGYAGIRGDNAYAFQLIQEFAEQCGLTADISERMDQLRDQFAEQVHELSEEENFRWLDHQLYRY